MSLVRVPIYPTRNLATEIDPGARSIVAGTNINFVTNPDGSITINSTGTAGTVTSVAATGSTGLTVGGSPITTSGTLTFTLSANLQSWSGIAPATKANLASPVFTGDPQAPTPATADNDTSIATTAFVKNQGYATTASLGSYVLKAGDTMSGTLTLAASYGLRFSGSAGGRLRILDDTGNPSLQWTNTGETLFSVGRYVATEHRFLLGTLDAYAGFRSFNATQVKVYDNNNDTPIELGLGYIGPTDRNGYLWNRNNGWLSFGTNNTERMRIQAGGAVDVTGGQFSVNGNNLVVNVGDIYTYRTGGTTGVIFLNNSGTRYLFNDGTNYVMPGQGLTVGGTIQSNALSLSGLSGGQGFQMIWNVVQAGQGRTEWINNRGGGTGGFTWWDRANTGAGTGTALAALTSAGLFVNGVVQFATGSTTVGQLSPWPANANYVSLTNTGMASNEYMIISAHPSIDTSTYISSAAGGLVNIRPSANSVTGQVSFSTSSVTSAVPYIDNTGFNVRRIAPVVLNNTQNLDSSHLNKVVEKSNTSNYTYTIPSGLGAHGDCITILNGNNSGTITIARGGGVSLYRNGLDANITVNPGNMVTIMRTSSSDRWQA